VKLNEDVTVPRGKVVDLFRLTAHLQKKHGVPISSFGHAGDGNIHVNLMAPVGTKPDDRHMHRILDELFRGVLQMGGVISGEHGIGLAKKSWWNSQHFLHHGCSTCGRCVPQATGSARRELAFIYGHQYTHKREWWKCIHVGSHACPHSRNAYRGTFRSSERNS
jgi:hypothetical protein